MDDQLNQWVSETRADSIRYDNEWDTRAVEWPQLPKQAVIVELGTYKGRWALQMMTNYPRIKYIGFEPQEWAFKTAYEVLRPYNTRLYNYGLGDNGGMLPMSNYGTDGCKFTNAQDNGMVKAEQRPIVSTLMELGLSEIDLMMVNIEGGEYTAVPPMLKGGIVPNTLVIQMHDGDSKSLYDLLNEYYRLIWDYGLTLSAWGIK